MEPPLPWYYQYFSGSKCVFAQGHNTAEVGIEPPTSRSKVRLGMEHYVLKLYKVYINDDSELTMKIVFVLSVALDIS